MPNLKEQFSEILFKSLRQEASADFKNSHYKYQTELARDLKNNHDKARDSARNSHNVHITSFISEGGNVDEYGDGIAAGSGELTKTELRYLNPRWSTLINENVKAHTAAITQGGNSGRNGVRASFDYVVKSVDEYKDLARIDDDKAMKSYLQLYADFMVDIYKDYALKASILRESINNLQKAVDKKEITQEEADKEKANLRENVEHFQRTIENPQEAFKTFINNKKEDIEKFGDELGKVSEQEELFKGESKEEKSKIEAKIKGIEKFAKNKARQTFNPERNVRQEGDEILGIDFAARLETLLQERQEIKERVKAGDDRATHNSDDPIYDAGRSEEESAQGDYPIYDLGNIKEGKDQKRLAEIEGLLSNTEELLNHFKSLREREKAATTLQAAFRGTMARKSVNKMRKQEEAKAQREAEDAEAEAARKDAKAAEDARKDAEDAAATIIQTAYRGHQVRKKEAEAARKDAKAAEDARKAAQDAAKRDAAATIIQAAYRGYQAKKKEAEAAKAAEDARKDAEDAAKRDAAARVIQGFYRGHQVRNEKKRIVEKYEGLFTEDNYPITVDREGFLDQIFSYKNEDGRDKSKDTAMVSVYNPKKGTYEIKEITRDEAKKLMPYIVCGHSNEDSNLTHKNDHITFESSGVFYSEFKSKDGGVAALHEMIAQARAKSKGADPEFHSHVIAKVEGEPEAVLDPNGKIIYDTVIVHDENGEPVLENGQPVTKEVPRINRQVDTPYSVVHQEGSVVTHTFVKKDFIEAAINGDSGAAKELTEDDLKQLEIDAKKEFKGQGNLAKEALARKKQEVAKQKEELEAKQKEELEAKQQKLKDKQEELADKKGKLKDDSGQEEKDAVEKLEQEFGALKNNIEQLETSNKEALDQIQEPELDERFSDENAEKQINEIFEELKLSKQAESVNEKEKERRLYHIKRAEKQLEEMDDGPEKDRLVKTIVKSALREEFQEKVGCLIREGRLDSSLHHKASGGVLDNLSSKNPGYFRGSGKAIKSLQNVPDADGPYGISITQGLGTEGSYNKKVTFYFDKDNPNSVFDTARIAIPGTPCHIAVRIAKKDGPVTYYKNGIKVTENFKAGEVIIDENTLLYHDGQQYVPVKVHKTNAINAKNSAAVSGGQNNLSQVFKAKGDADRILKCYNQMNIMASSIAVDGQTATSEMAAAVKLKGKDPIRARMPKVSAAVIVETKEGEKDTVRRAQFTRKIPGAKENPLKGAKWQVDSSNSLKPEEFVENREILLSVPAFDEESDAQATEKDKEKLQELKENARIKVRILTEADFTQKVKDGDSTKIVKTKHYIDQNGKTVKGLKPGDTYVDKSFYKKDGTEFSREEIEQQYGKKYFQSLLKIRAAAVTEDQFKDQEKTMLGYARKGNIEELKKIFADFEDREQKVQDKILQNQEFEAFTSKEERAEIRSKLMTAAMKDFAIDIFATNEEGQDALEIAALNNHGEMVEFLIEKGFVASKALVKEIKKRGLNPEENKWVETLINSSKTSASKEFSKKGSAEKYEERAYKKVFGKNAKPDESSLNKYDEKLTELSRSYEKDLENADSDETKEQLKQKFEEDKVKIVKELTDEAKILENVTTRYERLTGNSLSEFERASVEKISEPYYKKLQDLSKKHNFEISEESKERAPNEALSYHAIFTDVLPINGTQSNAMVGGDLLEFNGVKDEGQNEGQFEVTLTEIPESLVGVYRAGFKGMPGRQFLPGGNELKSDQKLTLKLKPDNKGNLKVVGYAIKDKYGAVIKEEKVDVRSNLEFDKALQKFASENFNYKDEYQQKRDEFLKAVEDNDEEKVEEIIEFNNGLDDKQREKLDLAGAKKKSPLNALKIAAINKESNLDRDGDGKITGPKGVAKLLIDNGLGDLESFADYLPKKDKKELLESQNNKTEENYAVPTFFGEGANEEGLYAVVGPAPAQPPATPSRTTTPTQPTTDYEEPAPSTSPAKPKAMPLEVDNDLSRATSV